MKKTFIALMIAFTSAAASAADFGSLAVSAKELGRTPPENAVPAVSKAEQLTDLRIVNLQDGAAAYEKVKKGFDEAAAAPEYAVAGWTSGRRFYKDGLAAPALLVGQHRDYDPGLGPLFENSVKLLALHVDYTDQPLDFFDNMPKAVADSVKGLLDSDAGRDAAYKIRFPEAKGVIKSEKYTYKVELRVSASHYIFERMEISDLDGTVRGVNYAYFFKDVTPK